MITLRRVALALAALVCLAGPVLALAALHGCSASAVHAQATAAEAAAVVANRAELGWIAALHAEGRAAADAACAPPHIAEPGCVDARLAAADRVVAKWQAVALAWEGLRQAHDVWAERLDRCDGVDGAPAPADGGACDPGALAELAGEVALRTLAWRCEVRALGRADLDPFPGPASGCDSPPYDAGPPRDAVPDRPSVATIPVRAPIDIDAGANDP